MAGQKGAPHKGGAQEGQQPRVPSYPQLQERCEHLIALHVSRGSRLPSLTPSSLLQKLQQVVGETGTQMCEFASL